VLLVTLLATTTPAAEPTFHQALHPREWSFPRDHGRHDGFKTEWWYFTGNLRERTTNRLFGYQLTFFRSAFTPPPATTRPSPWATTDLYFAHAALADVTGKRFLFTDRLSRARPGLAFASDQTLDVTLKDWSANLDGDTMRLLSRDDQFNLDLTTRPGRGPVLQGPGGLNPKGTNVGQASYYYSVTRMPTTGTITVAGKTFDVQGLSWMDHEFSSHPLAENQIGWDWLALTMNDGTDLMLYRLRDKSGQADYLSGTRIDPAGKSHLLTSKDITLTPAGQWKSPASGGAYPRQWAATVHNGPRLTIKPRLENQELATPNSGDIHYYEGTVEVTDDAGKPLGEGYMEMTGYAKPLKP
jgi:predicted secreted hydrolase